MKYQFNFLENEYWWGGSTVDGCENPFSKNSVFACDYREIAYNQTVMLFLSNKGRYIWSEDLFDLRIENGIFYIEGGQVELVEAGNTLKDAYLAAMKTHFPFDGKELPREFFKTAQYNTWMEFTYHPTQDGVLRYAHDILEHGLKPGIFIIDEGWQQNYGVWKFDERKFPDPKSMVQELHDLGFTVMLWVVPWVACSGQNFVLDSGMEEVPNRDNIERFIRNSKGDIAIFEWWNGYSAMLDLEDPKDFAFLDGQLQALINDYGVDGFKFDGGSITEYHPSKMINGPVPEGWNPERLNRVWNEFGLRYRFHEYKDTYKGGGKNCIQRLCDKNHAWEPDGINMLIPCSVLQGLLGYPFICPDMIGGGLWNINVTPGFKIDQELFVRMAQVSALCPMMQFSWAPWKALNELHFDMVLQAAKLHEQMADEIITLIEEAERGGEPILRNMEYNYPNRGFETIIDQFMLEENILVAPVVTPRTYAREVTFPQGKWEDEKGNIYEGNQTILLPSPLDTLLWFRKIK